MEWRLFANLRETAGTNRVTIEDTPATVAEALEALFDSYPPLEERVIGDDGTVADHINVLKNGVPVTGLDTDVEDDDELALFPPVSGG